MQGVAQNYSDGLVEFLLFDGCLLTQLIGVYHLKSETKRYQEINASITQDLKIMTLRVRSRLENISGS